MFLLFLRCGADGGHTVKEKPGAADWPVFAIVGKISSPFSVLEDGKLLQANRDWCSFHGEITLKN